jgi:hypothetical protein
MAARGERTFKSGSREVTVLFTNRALAGAEKRLGKGIIGIADGLLSGASGMAEIAVLLQVGMEAARVDARQGGQQISLEKAYDVLDEVGFAAVAQPVMEAVAAVLSYAPVDGDNVIEGSAKEADPNL